MQAFKYRIHRILLRSYHIASLSDSFLYVRGKDAYKRRSIVLPYFGTEELLSKKVQFENSLDSRKLQLDLTSFDETVNRFAVATEQLKKVQDEIQEISSFLKEVTLEEGDESANAKTTKDKLSELKEREKSCKDALRETEKTAVPLMLSLPNTLTNVGENFMENFCHTYIDAPEFSFKPKSHTQLGKRDIVLDTVSGTYYLKGKPALLELNLIDYFFGKLIKNGLIPFNGSDTVISPVLEACGKNPGNLEESLIMLDRQNHGGHNFHLVGSASLESFLAYYTRRLVKLDELPLSYFVAGRCYENSVNGVCSDLYLTRQSTRISIFHVHSNVSINTITEFLKIIVSSYQEIGIPFRVVLVEPSSLQQHESLRVQIEVWSPHLECYIECGNLSMHGDFLSKRLNMLFSAEKEIGFLQTIHGCVVNVPVLVGSLIENFQTKEGSFNIPEVL